MPNPWQARRWREGGTEGAYTDMDPDVRPGAEPAHGPHLADLATPQPTAAWLPSPPAGYPEGGNVEAVLAWASRGDDCASYALQREHARPEPRRTVLGPLQRQLAGQ